MVSPTPIGYNGHTYPPPKKEGRLSLQPKYNLCIWQQSQSLANINNAHCSCLHCLRCRCSMADQWTVTTTTTTITAASPHIINLPPQQPHHWPLAASPLCQGSLLCRHATLPPDRPASTWRHGVPATLVRQLIGQIGEVAANPTHAFSRQSPI